MEFRFLPAGVVDPVSQGFRQQFDAVRHHVFVEREGWETDTDQDGYDPRTDYFVAIRQDEVVRGCRLIARQKMGKLPIEDCLEPGYEIDLRDIEVSRLATVGQRLPRGYFMALISHLVEQDCRSAYMVIREDLLRFLQRHSSLGVYTQLPGQPKLKRSRNGKEHRFLPAMLSVEGMRESIDFFERAEAFM